MTTRVFVEDYLCYPSPTTNIQ